LDPGPITGLLPPNRPGPAPPCIGNLGLGCIPSALLLLFLIVYSMHLTYFGLGIMLRNKDKFLVINYIFEGKDDNKWIDSWLFRLKFNIITGWNKKVLLL
jgi:hypothetical protein